MHQERPRFFGARAWSTLLFSIGVTAITIVPHARADAPECRYIPTNGTVLDSDTGLTWQQDTDTIKRAWGDASSYCANLQLEGSGWRLPAVHELQTIVDETRSDHAIDPAFMNPPSEPFFWSSSPSVSEQDQAWRVDFSDGNVHTDPVIDVYYYVRCVR